jgi:hypothetical protein
VGIQFARARHTRRIEEFFTGVVLDELVQRTRRGKQWTSYRYQWFCDVPLRGDAKAINVNWFMIEIVNLTGEVTYCNS